MDEKCIVCGAPATRRASTKNAVFTASVCGAKHAAKWRRQMKRARAREGRGTGPVLERTRRGADAGQLTFLGGKPVG
jgi:hypothetical protein